MKIGRVSFSEEGYKEFKKKTKKQQKEYLKDRMPWHTGIDKLLKNIPYGKLQSTKKETKSSKRSKQTGKSDKTDNSSGSKS